MGRVLVRLISAVILAVTLPGLGDAPFICTLPLVGFTLVCSCREDIFKNDVIRNTESKMKTVKANMNEHVIFQANSYENEAGKRTQPTTKDGVFV